jgi:two-component system sensor histidine kinase UhpB
MPPSLSSASLFWRVFAMNAVVFALGTAALAFTPATVSFPLALTEAIVLLVGLLAMLLANAFLLRLSFSPLAGLVSLMERIDLLRPGQRLPTSGPREVAEVVDSFNEMLERLETERRVSSGRVLRAQEEERRRVAQDLHDEIGQRLTAVVLELKRAAEHAPRELQPILLDAQETARSSVDEVRRIVRQLRPEALDELGLVSALAALGSAFAERTGLAFEPSFPPKLPPLARDSELAVYRVAQESLTNVARHAGATTVRLSLGLEPGAVILAVADDGAGFSGLADDGGGVRGMRERALLVGGEIALSRSAEGGVEVRLRVPVDAG